MMCCMYCMSRGFLGRTGERREADKTQLRLAAARENIGTRRGRRGERGGATDAEELRRRRGAHMEGNERRGACDVLAPRGTLAD